MKELETEDQLVLTYEEAKEFIKGIEKPRKPVEELIEAIKLYKEKITCE